MGRLSHAATIYAQCSSGGEKCIWPWETRGRGTECVGVRRGVTFRAWCPLPPQYEVHLKILSFLDAKSLCMIARTCRRFNKVAEDELLWKQRLSQDSHRWTMVGHLSHPAIHQLVSPEASTKSM